MTEENVLEQPSTSNGSVQSSEQREANRSSRKRGFDEMAPMTCDECDSPFTQSFLYDNYDFTVCDECRSQEKHRLITKAEAKRLYVLSDGQIEDNEALNGAPLRFVLRKNPRNPKWGEMHLYLEAQIAAVALRVHSDAEKLETAREKRELNRANLRNKRFEKRLQELRFSVRTSLLKKSDGASAHEHTFGEEQLVDEEEGTYKHTCTACGFVQTFEKL